MVSKITDMINKSEPGSNFNMTPLKQEELRPIDIIELIDDKEKALAQLSQKIIIPPYYFEGQVGTCLPKLLK